MDIPAQAGLAPGFLVLKPSSFFSSFHGVSTRRERAGDGGSEAQHRSVTVSPASSLHSFSLSTQRASGRLHLLVHNATSSSAPFRSTTAQSMMTWGAGGVRLFLSPFLFLPLTALTRR